MGRGSEKLSFFYPDRNVWFVYSSYTLYGIGSAVAVVSIYADMLLISKYNNDDSVQIKLLCTMMQEIPD